MHVCLNQSGNAHIYIHFSSYQFSSVAQLCPILCDPMSHSMPGLPVHHQLPEFTKTHVHWVGDAMQPSRPLSSPSPPAPNPSQHQGLFQWVNSSHEVAKVLEFQLQHLSFNDCMYVHDIHACDFTFDICVYAYAFPDGLVCARMCKLPQAYNCSYMCIRAWTQIHACPCSHVHKCTFVVECRDWRREFSACLLADTVHNKCRKTISQGLKISNLRSTCAPWSQPERLKLRRLPRMMGEVPGLNFLE